MKLVFSYFFSFLFVLNTFSQIGINSPVPKATLHMEKSQDFILGTNEGLIITRLTGDEIQAMNSPERSTLVFATASATKFPIIINNPGFWYYNGSIWSRLDIDTYHWEKQGAALYPNHIPNAVDRLLITADGKLIIKKPGIASTTSYSFFVNGESKLDGRVGIGTDPFPGYGFSVFYTARFANKVQFSNRVQIGSPLSTDTTSNSVLEIGGSIATSIKREETSANFTLGDYKTLVYATQQAGTVILPFTESGKLITGREYTIINSSNYSLIVKTDLGYLINGKSSITIPSNYSVSFIRNDLSMGTVWEVTQISDLSIL